MQTITAEPPLLYRTFLLQSITKLCKTAPSYPHWQQLDAWLIAAGELLGELRRDPQTPDQVWANHGQLALALHYSTRRPIADCTALIERRIR